MEIISVLSPTRIDQISVYYHVTLSFKGKITIYGLKKPSNDQIYALIHAQAMNDNLSNRKKDILELILWSSSICPQTSQVANKKGDKFFGPGSVVIEISPIETFVVMTKRTAIDYGEKYDIIRGDGLWSMADSHWRIEISIEGSSKMLKPNEIQSSDRAPVDLYIQSDMYNPYNAMSSSSLPGPSIGDLAAAYDAIL